jgi:hypothetical protein
VSVIRWEDPPPPKHRPRPPAAYWRAIAGELRLKPGVWAIIDDGSPTARVAAVVASQIRHGRRSDFPEGEFEAEWRTTSDGKHQVYARYVGGAE